MPNWTKENLKFGDGRAKYIANESKGNGKYYTREEIQKLVQQEADKLKNAGVTNAVLGVAYHFKNINNYVPAIMTPITQPIAVWDVNDSDKGAIYDGDHIDKIHFVMIKDEGNNPKYLKPKAPKPEVSYKKLFEKAKKK